MDSQTTADRMALRDRLRERVRYRPITLRPAQRIGDQPFVVLVGGRRSGKTIAAAEHVADLLIAGRGLVAVVGPTFGQARDVCIEQQRSGVLDALARRGVRVRREGRGEWEWNRSIGELRYRGESVLRIDGLEDGAPRVQGHAVACAWLDELRLAPERAGETALDQSIFPALSGSRNPQLIVTTTPAATRLVRRVLNDPQADKRTMTIWENAEHLPPAYLAQMRERYAGTRLGRQELDGILLEDSERALVRREWIEQCRVEEAPAELIKLRAVGLDPGGEGSQALCMVSSGLDGFVYVERAEMVSGSAADFLRHAVTVAVTHDAMLIVERNHGGEYLQDLLSRIMAERRIILPTRMVWASVGKRTRAEPVALLIEQGKVKWVGEHPELEDEWCVTDWDRESPHLADAMVWACNAVMGSTTIGHEQDLRAVPWDSAPPWGSSPLVPTGLEAVPYN